MHKKIVPAAHRGPFNPLINRGSTALASTSFEAVQEAVVTDCVVNDTHPSYASDGYNIGCIQFRLIKVDQFKDKASLGWAFPVDSNISEYPLLGEIVHIVPSLNRSYYTRKVNTSSKVTSHSLTGLESELSPIEGPAKKVQTLQKSIANPTKRPTASESLGKFFKEPSPRVFRLRHDEGDIIIEGRSGQSLRFGASWPNKTQFMGTVPQSPNIMLRVGQSPTVSPSTDTEFGVVTEDINNDATSLYMVSDQEIGLTYSTEKGISHGKSIVDFPTKLDGNQLVINTNRFVVNAKRSKIMGFSDTGIHWTTNMDATTDSGRDNRMWVGRDYIRDVKRNTFTYTGNQTRHRSKDSTTLHAGGVIDILSATKVSVVAPEVFLGVDSDKAQPIPLGAMLADFLMKFLDAHIMNASTHVITPTGPGVLNPTIVTALTKLKTDVARGAFASFNSTHVFSTKNSPSVSAPPDTSV